MSRPSRRFVLGLFAAALPALVLLGACDATLEGTVLRVGNEPFSMLVLRIDDGRDLALEGPLLAELERLQNRRVRLEGELLEGGPPGAAARLAVSSIEED
ncbi:MAG: hypothetical protein JXA15_01870 [Spirochaetales bacterium]|nr:hypothetical protein [Spirochaetales bacterium]